MKTIVNIRMLKGILRAQVFAHSSIFLYNPLYSIQLAQFLIHYFVKGRK